MTPSKTEPLPLARLLDNRRLFLNYLERRVGDRATAEDILQDAFVKAVERPEQAPTDEGVVPWFYPSLRNAAIDRLRWSGTANKALEASARELENQESATAQFDAETCACVSRLAQTLKPEYAEALTSIEVNGIPVKTVASERGLSPTNAGVRVHRAREALKRRVTESCGVCAEHGCMNCNCNEP